MMKDIFLAQICKYYINIYKAYFIFIFYYVLFYFILFFKGFGMVLGILDTIKNYLKVLNYSKKM